MVCLFWVAIGKSSRGPKTHSPRRPTVSKTEVGLRQRSGSFRQFATH